MWIADAANLGASGIQNEELLGDDRECILTSVLSINGLTHPASWFDHSRDLMCMINQFRGEMPQPIVGIGHSMGAGQL